MIKARFDKRRFNNDLKKFGLKVNSSLDQATKQAADNIAADTRTLDSDTPDIAASITTGKNEPGNGYYVNKGGNLPLPDKAVWKEFGTGRFAKSLLSGYPKDWKDMAWFFKRARDGFSPAAPALFPVFNRHAPKIAYEASKKING